MKVLLSLVLEVDLGRELLRERDRAPNLLDILSRVLLRLSTWFISSWLSCCVPSSSRLPWVLVVSTTCHPTIEIHARIRIVVVASSIVVADECVCAGY